MEWKISEWKSAGWKSSGCCVPGSDHRKKQIPCQDRIYQYHSEQISVIALADGAGSARFGGEGAEIAVRECVRLFITSFDRFYETEDARIVSRKILDHLFRTLYFSAKKNKGEVKDMASTLLAAAVKGDRYLLVHIGDGVIGCRKNGKMYAVSHPENGEFVNETFFLTSQNAETHFRLYKGEIQDIDCFLLMSDGAQTSLYQAKNRKLIEETERLAIWNSCLFAEIMNETLNNTIRKVLINYTEDDCSLVMMNRIRPEDYLNMELSEKRFLLMTDEVTEAELTEEQIRQTDEIMRNLLVPLTEEELKKRIPDGTLEKGLRILQAAGLVKNTCGRYRSVYTQIGS